MPSAHEKRQAFRKLINAGPILIAPGAADEQVSPHGKPRDLKLVVALVAPEPRHAGVGTDSLSGQS